MDCMRLLLPVGFPCIPRGVGIEMHGLICGGKTVFIPLQDRCPVSSYEAIEAVRLFGKRKKERGDGKLIDGADDFEGYGTDDRRYLLGV